MEKKEDSKIEFNFFDINSKNIFTIVLFFSLLLSIGITVLLASRNASLEKKIDGLENISTSESNNQKELTQSDQIVSNTRIVRFQEFLVKNCEKMPPPPDWLGGNTSDFRLPVKKLPFILDRSQITINEHKDNPYLYCRDYGRHPVNDFQLHVGYVYLAIPYEINESKTEDGNKYRNRIILYDDGYLFPNGKGYPYQTSIKTEDGIAWSAEFDKIIGMMPREEVSSYPLKIIGVRRNIKFNNYVTFDIVSRDVLYLDDYNHVQSIFRKYSRKNPDGTYTLLESKEDEAEKEIVDYLFSESNLKESDKNKLENLEIGLKSIFPEQLHD